MVLSFNPKFVEPILLGTKILTLRDDPHARWHPGRSIQFYSPEPLNGGKKFREDGIAEYVDWIDISLDGISNSNIWIRANVPAFYKSNREVLAQLDGFASWKRFLEFHCPDGEPVRKVLVCWDRQAIEKAMP